MRIVLAVLTGLSWLTIAAPAMSQERDYSDMVESRLSAGEPVRMLVWFSGPEIAADISDHEIGWRQDRLAEIRRNTLDRVFGADGYVTSGESSEYRRPAVIREFDYAPVASMLLDRASVERLRADPGVRHVDIDPVYAPSLGVSSVAVQADILHDDGATGAGVSIAILDTGVDHSHPAFADRFADSACFSSTVEDLSTSFCPGGVAVDTTSLEAGDNCEEVFESPDEGAEGCFHGTHVAGIAGASPFPTDNQGIIQGMAPEAGIVAVQVFSRFTDPDFCGSADACALSYVSDQLAALEWLYDNRDRLNLATVNMSLGGGRYSGPCDDHPHAPIIGLLRDAGVATIVASGNNSFNGAVTAPACIDAAIAVGSSTTNEVIYSSFSNVGPMLDFFAPGEDITSTIHSAGDSGILRWGSASGTSMAAPHVAGGMALLLSRHPDATVDEIESALQVTGSFPRVIGNFYTAFIKLANADSYLSSFPGGRVGGLRISRYRRFASVGFVDQENSFTTEEYRLTNESASPVDWSVRTPHAWLLVAQAADEPDTLMTGRLGAGESISFTASVNPGGLAPQRIASFLEIEDETNNKTLLVAASIMVRRIPPENDRFADAFVLQTANIPFDARLIEATAEEGEPDHAGEEARGSIWYQWFPPVSGEYLVRATAFNFDPRVAVYSGDALDALTETAESLGDTVIFDAVARTPVFIAVDGREETGAPTARFTIEPRLAPPNDDLANAQVLTGSSGHVFAYAATGSLEDGESVQPFFGINSIWYRWVAPESGPTAFEIPYSGNATRTHILSAPSFEGPFVAQSAGGRTEFEAIAEQEYFIRIGGVPSPNWTRFPVRWHQNIVPDHRLRAAVLPTSRAIRTGDTATGFATLVNPAGWNAAALNCRIELPADSPHWLSYQTTDPATNAPVGTPDTPVDIPIGGAQTFVFSIRSGRIPLSGEILLEHRCDNTELGVIIAGVSTFRLSLTAFDTADVIAIAATPSGDGIVSVPVDGIAAFSVAAVNIGRGERISAEAVFSGTGAPVSLEICETNPVDGRCLTGRAPNTQSRFEGNESRTFTVFVRGTGTDLPFNAAAHRLFIRFLSGERIVGETSVAVRTLP